jgi:hypothetical protein
MDVSNPIAPTIPIYPVPYAWAFLIILLAVIIYYFIESGSHLADIQANWPEYRCQPQMMPLAGLFGHDINENFQFCIQQIIQENTKGVTGPFAQGMGGFTSVLMNLMNSANSFRTMLATLVGGVIKIVSEFKARMTALMSRIKITASRMKAMMYRIYGTMFAVIYMGMSAQTGIANFGDSFIFKFIDTFCFPPEQPIELQDGKVVPISTIVLGDVLKGGQRVETIYQFMADGQEMVKIDNITVSSNHFIQYKEKWVMAKDHPDAISIGSWSGGITRPLICLTTDDHRIPIGYYVFADYDETNEGDATTREWVGNSLNGKKSKIPPHPKESYEIGSPYTSKVLTLQGYKTLDAIKLGDMITRTSKVVGIQVSQLDEFCILPGGEKVATGSLLWSPLKGEWIRAYTMYPIEHLSKPLKTIALFVSPGAQYILEGGIIVRDAMEIYSPDTKHSYAEALLKAEL